jgi:hypothetical protein
LHGADLLDFERQINKLSTTGDFGPILQDILKELHGIDVQSFISDSGAEYNLQVLIYTHRTSSKLISQLAFNSFRLSG